MSSLLMAWSGAYLPQGVALRWQPGLLWVHVLAHATLALACVISVPALYRRSGNAAGSGFAPIAAVLIAGTVLHLVAIVTLWNPIYLVEAGVKAVTALAGICAAYALWQPRAKILAPLPAEDPLRAERDAALRERDTARAQLGAETARREAAEAAATASQKFDAVGQLTGAVAHDFNNLLQAVAGNLELIARKPDDADRIVRWSGSALDAVERGRALTSQLLAFSRKQRFDVTSVRIAELVGGMRDLLERAVAPLSRVAFKPIDPTWNVRADALQIELAMLNLAFAARDAMPKGGVFTVSAERRGGAVAPGLPHGEYVALVLADERKGADEADTPGLSMAEGALRQSGGALTIETDANGRRVTLFLPVATSEPARDIPDDAARDTRIDLGGCTIALVDDDAQVRATIAETLIAAGAHVSEASNGAAGVALVHANRPDMLVVDFGMPEMSGAEVARQVRAIHPELPVLLVTGLTELASVDCVRGPGIGVLKKPFVAQQLLREVHALIGRKA